MLPLLLWLSVVTVRNDDTVLRSGCESGTAAVTKLSSGQAVRIRFSIAGATPCYKLSVNVDGRDLAGYLDHAQLDGLEEFDRGRQSAGAIAVIGSIQQQATRAIQNTGGLGGVVEAIEANEPGRALELLRPLLSARADPDLLALAGVAAWRNDEPREALEFWNRSLRLRPDPRIEQLCRTVEREASGDRSSGKAYGLRVLLRYEPDAVRPELARSMVDTLDAELQRIFQQLGCVARERLVAVVQSRDAYLASTGAAEWSGGRYDGRIRIALMDNGIVGPGTRRVFAHELVHACLSNLGRWPPWLHEGLAQLLSGDRLTAAQRGAIRGKARSGEFPKLDLLGRDLGSMDTRTARDTYALALEAASLLMERYSGVGLRNILSNPSLLQQITGELERVLGM